MQTPFDDVRSALRGGPIVRASPQLYPPPSRSTIKGMPQSMQVPRSAQPAFTFGATKQRLLASVPAKLAPSANLALPGGLGDEGTPAQTRKKMVFGSQRGSAMKEGEGDAACLDAITCDTAVAACRRGAHKVRPHQ